MKPSNVLLLYRVRLRARAAQECLAIAGIAAGVALLFASQVSSSSLQGSVSDLEHGVAGNATLQLAARDPHGISQGLVGRVRRLAGVRFAAPLLEADAQASGPDAGEPVELIGADQSLPALGGTLVPHGELTPFGGIGAVVMAAPLSHALGVIRFGQEVTLRLAGHTVQAPLYAQLGERQIGQLARSPVVIAPLSYAQEIAGLQGRVSRVLIQPEPGARTRVRGELMALTAGRANVEPIGYEATLFANAVSASSQSSALFSAISAFVGFLFAFNATLLTVPARRRLIVDLRRDGYAPRTVIATLCLDALVLGVLASALGLALGDVLFTRVLRSDSAFFSLGFTVGSEQSVSFTDVAIAAAGGMLAAFAAVLSPLRAVLSHDPLAARSERESSGASWASARTALAGLACLAASSALLAIEPDAAIPGMVLVIAALLCVLPLTLRMTLALAGWLAAFLISPVGHVARMELSAGRTRAVAIAATGAVAVFGSVAIGGAHRDLLAGLRTAARETTAAAPVWVAPAGSYNLLMTTPFAPLAQRRLRHVPGVQAVELYRGGLLDYGRRRVLVIAPPLAARPLLPKGQLLGGDARRIEALVRSRGWIVVSRVIAEEHDLRVGHSVTLPTPNPTRMYVAALSTNMGWEPGAIVMSAPSYARAWASTDASAYAIQLAPGISPSRGAREIQSALGPSRQSALAVQSARQRSGAVQALDARALARLTQIATLIPIFAILAMAAAIGAMVWQRRARLAKLKLEGLARAQLWRTILLESLLLLGAGCVTGALFGLYGQHLADRALAQTLNFPVDHSLSPLPALASVGLVIAAALAVLALPGYLASGVPASVALQE
ncbi:MAG TPA: ABC transporter permease [Solirubrobacteraceae bacterium]|nr:ABC transporter permease [Solirubrobacteraceae bacterium]